MKSAVSTERLAYLDAVRSFALLLGIVFHASLSFIPVFIGWAVMDISTSSIISAFVLVSHSFRMALFFMIAGFFGHRVFHKKGVGSFMGSRFVRIVIPLIVGWFILRPLMISGWIMGGASLRGDVDIIAGLKDGFQSLETLPTGLFTGTHLWFLYYLIMVTLLVISSRQLLTLLPKLHAKLAQCGDSTVTWLAGSSVSLIILSLPTAAGLWFMTHWGMDTPDKSLLPHFPTLAIYGGFFSFGWILSRNQTLIEQFARLTPTLWITCVGSIVATFLLERFQFQTNHAYYTQAHIAYVFTYALTMWSLVWLTIGIFKRICHKPNKAIRYIADSSYWLYLVHLPIVVWLQIAFAELPLHWSVKLTAISVITIGLSLLFYDLFVRNTIIGSILNGRKRERILRLSSFTSKWNNTRK